MLQKLPVSLFAVFTGIANEIIALRVICGM